MSVPKNEKIYFVFLTDFIPVVLFCIVVSSPHFLARKLINGKLFLSGSSLCICIVTSFGTSQTTVIELLDIGI